MSLINIRVDGTAKPFVHHPWAKSIKRELSDRIKYAHNSINNPVYPKPKKKEPQRKGVGEKWKFLVFGDRCSREFLYCKKLLEGLYKYRSKVFDAPEIRGVSTAEWPQLLNELKIKYSELTYCLTGRVAIIFNNKCIGGQKELQELIGTKYKYYVTVDYPKEGLDAFTKFIKSSGRAFVYLNIAIDDKLIGSMIFMLYNDIVPNTCENFMRLCKNKTGGYAGTPVHRIVKDGWIQCGGYGLKSSDLDCENFAVPHDKRGVLAMANDGWHQDCSTQFFVLLQPAPWMQSKYVAFGQLIDGEKTLQQIENTETWYESPLKNICILQAGILNVDCDDIMINRGTVKYIDDHTEDLVALGEYLAEIIIQSTFLALDFKRVTSMESQLGEGEQVEAVDKDIRATERFLHDKSEIEKQLGGTGAPGTYRGPAHGTPYTQSENDDFDVEDYDYVPEDYTSSEESKAPTVAKKLPYFIPLTDVPYEGDVDSTFNLMKILKGDYCLESDLVVTKNTKEVTEKSENMNLIVPEIFDPIYESESDSGGGSEIHLEPEDEEEIKEYLNLYSDKASFGGARIKSIAHRADDFVTSFKSETAQLNDEGIRKLRLVAADVEAHRQKKIGLPFTPRDILPHTEIKRRPTGFIRDDEIVKFIKLNESEEDYKKDKRVSKTASDVSIETLVPEVKKETVTIKEPKKESFDMDKKRPSLFKHFEEKVVKKKGAMFADITDDEDTGPTPKGVLMKSKFSKTPSQLSEKARGSEESISGDEKEKRSILSGRITQVAETRATDKTEVQKQLAFEPIPTCFKKPHEKKNRKVLHIKPPDNEEEMTHEHKMKRRQTGLVTKEMLMKLRLQDEDDEDDDEITADSINERPSMDKRISSDRRRSSQPRPSVDHRRIAEQTSVTDQRKSSIRTENGDEEPRRLSKVRYLSEPDISPRQMLANKHDELTKSHRQDSVLVRLYDAPIESDNELPTLRDYKPLSEVHTKTMLLTATPPINTNDNYKTEYLLPSTKKSEEPNDQVLSLQLGRKVQRKISSDYVTIIEQTEHKNYARSLRSFEFAKTRPSLTVSQYQLMNQEYQKQLKDGRSELSQGSRERKQSQVSSKTGKEKSLSAIPERSRDIHGLRLPGDSPLYMDD